jgi:hypothetical protein
MFKRDPYIIMNNHQNIIFHQLGNFLKTLLALLGVFLKSFQVNKCYTAILWEDKICYFVYTSCGVLTIHDYAKVSKILFFGVRRN